MGLYNLKYNSVVITGGGFGFVDGNASSNLSVEFALAYKELGFSPIIIPQNPSLSDQEASYGSYRGIEYSYPLKRKNIVAGYGGWRNSVNYRLGVLINPLLTGWFIWRRRKTISHVFSQTLRPTTLAILGVACRFSGLPLVYHLVEEPWSLTAQADLTGWRRLLRALQVLPPVIFLYALVLRFLVTKVACITDQLMELLRRLGYSRYQLLYLPNVRYLAGENSVEVNPEMPKSYDDPFFNLPYLLYSGQVSAGKESFRPLFEALRKLNADGGRVALRIYGGGHPDAVSRVCKLIEEADVHRWVRYFGFVDRNTLAEAQRNAFLCLLLKRDVAFNRYNFPTKLMDYLVNKKPVLMSNLELHNKYFTNKFDALIVCPDSVDEIHDALMWSLLKPEQLNIIGNRGGEILRKEFCAVNHVRELLKSCRGVGYGD
ncbi:glycosyltransferase [Desulforhopalus singaporensis]|uniref:Glycosyltransferase involved in cell wall bisynthesis n=1 Tax=Desulforhopalus singaporensis TaxID=91360 RepID=A0A1H0UXQ2_9BACT|nr:glycosyltransferase [Desulforhopalus singaporensis]SDP70881.1 Glycosyltransferase involved in cell wall bisynthesis [Desulforhopalus singaporensis]